MSSIPESELDEFFAACEKQNIDKAKLMLQNNEALITCKDQSGNCPLHLAVKSNYPMDLVRLLSHPAVINQSNNNGETPLILAAAYNDAQISRHLIDDGADINAADKDGHSPLQWSVVNRALDILDDLLVRNNASVNSGDCSGCRALHYATTDFDQPSLIIKQLMEHGADVDCADNEGRTPLHWASSCGNVEAFTCLLQYNPHVECLDNCNLTVLHCAVSRNQLELTDVILCRTTFQDYPDPKDSNGCTPLFYSVSLGFHQMSELLLSRKAMVNAQDKKLRSCTHYAAARGQLESLKLLRKYYASFDLLNHRGDLPIHEAVQCGNYACVKYLLSLNEKFSNAKNHTGRTPLHLAAASKSDDVQLCKLLVENGGLVDALVTGKNRKLYTSLDIAEAKMNHEIIAYLRSILAKRADDVKKEDIEGIERSPASNDEDCAKNRTVDTMVQTTMEDRKIKHKCKKFRRKRYKTVYILRSRTSEMAPLIKKSSDNEGQGVGNVEERQDEKSRLADESHTCIKNVPNSQASEGGIEQDILAGDGPNGDSFRNGNGPTGDKPRRSKTALPSHAVASNYQNGLATASQISSHWSSTVDQSTAGTTNRRGARLCEIYARAAATARSPKLTPAAATGRRENLLKEEKMILQQLAILKRVELMYGKMQEKYLVKKMVDDWRQRTRPEKRGRPAEEENLKISTFESWEKFLYKKLEKLRQRQNED